MLTELREAKFREIEQNAQRQKAAADYIVRCIESDESLFRGAFFGNDFELTEQADTELYTKVSGIIKELTNEHTRPFGVNAYRMRPGDESMPAAKLGWATYEPPSYLDEEELAQREEVPHILRLTETGVNVINGLQDALGLPTLEIQLQRNRASWETATGSVPQVPGT